ncbi:MAG: Hpt domain-containing protein [Faecalibacterium sp.]|jgi:hypothetical protein|nr:Hpt domain-containing protein [Faecalibacterium sp.]
MNRDVWISAGVNYEEGIRRFLGNSALYEKFVLRFPGDPTYAALDAAMAQKDTAEAFRQAHTLKGAAGNLSFVQLYQDVQPLVEALRAQDQAAADTLYPAVQADYIRLVDVLRAEG